MGGDGETDKVSVGVDFEEVVGCLDGFLRVCENMYQKRTVTVRETRCRDGNGEVRKEGAREERQPVYKAESYSPHSRTAPPFGVAAFRHFPPFGERSVAPRGNQPSTLAPGYQKPPPRNVRNGGDDKIELCLQINLFRGA